MSGSGRPESTISEGRVKLHVFEPSGRKVWTVVGREEEHWVDPVSGYCSCRAFYFGLAVGRASCYHLESARMAAREGKAETVKFADDEFADFVRGLASGL